MGCCITKQSVVEENQKQDNNKIENKEEENTECVISPLTINETILNNFENVETDTDQQSDQPSKTIQDNDTDIELELDSNLSKLNLKSDLDSEVFDISAKDLEFVEREPSEHDIKKSKHFSQLGSACVKNNFMLDNKKTRISSVSRATSPLSIISITPSTV